MARLIFPEWSNTLKKWIGILVLGAPIYLVGLIAYGVSPEAIRIGYMPAQPVPYSHAMHVGELGMDCLYCHNTVDRSPAASIPPAATCMNCHETIRPDSAKLLPIREAVKIDKPVEWVRVTDLPDYVFFNHSAHVTRGIGCVSCHGRVDKMVEVYQAKPLTMSWCLNCHRAPEASLRPVNKVTDMTWKPAGGQAAFGAAFRKKNGINPPTNCSTCHR